MKWILSNALRELRPNSAFGVKDDDYNQILWDENNVDSLPTEAEINAKIVELDAAEPMRLLRTERNNLLIESDWTQFPDVPDSIKTAWQPYRQQLRDLPATASPKLDESYELDLSSVTWPTKPS